MNKIKSPCLLIIFIFILFLKLMVPVPLILMFFFQFKPNTTRNIALYSWICLRNLHSKTHQITPFRFQFVQFLLRLRGEHPPSDFTATKNKHDPPLMWHGQGEWVGCRSYCFWDIGKKRGKILLFYIVFSTDKFFITLYNLISNRNGVCFKKWSIWWKSYEKVV